jgi:uncharacterized protein (TIGR01777 family)
MKIAIAGHSGFIGSNLCSYLIRKGHSIIKINRMDLERPLILRSKISSAEAVINLCGSPIYGSWKDSGREKIINSRILPVRAINQVINELTIKPKVFISASAVGIYQINTVHDDLSKDYSNSFPAEVVKMWENEFFKNDFTNVRKVALRMGIVLDKKGGLFKRIYQFHNYGFLPAITDENAPFPCIVLHDLLRIYELALHNDNLSGSVNAVLPIPVKSGEFYRKVRSSSPFLFLLKINPKTLEPFFGERILTLNQNPIVYPRIILETGFHFDFPEVDCYLKKLRG